MPAPEPAQAFTNEQKDLWIGCTILGVIATPLIAYGIWKNLPQNRNKPPLFKGEFYVGGFMGKAITPSQDLKYPDGITLNPGNGPVATQGPVTLLSNKFQASPVGGVKFGYFTHRIPYLGLEVETYINRSNVYRNTLTLSRPINGSTVATVPADKWMNWTTALHIVGRYGFLPDMEVPFGRL